VSISRLYKNHPLRLASRKLAEVCKDRPDLLALGSRALRNIADFSAADTADITLLTRAETVLHWVAVLARPHASDKDRRQARLDVQALDAELTEESEAQESESGQ